MDRFAEALSEVLADMKGIELTEDEAKSLLQAADEKTDPSIFSSLQATHELLDQMGVPKEYTDGNEASVDARLVAFMRHVQEGGSAGGGCAGGCCH